MKYLNDSFVNFRNWFIGLRLSETNDAINKIRLKIAFNVYLVFAIISLLYIPFLVKPELINQFIIATLVLLINVGLLLSLKIYNSLKTGGIIHLVSLFMLITFQMYNSQGSVSFITVSWFTVASIFGFFQYGRKAGFAIMSVSFAIISVFIYLKFSNYIFPPYRIDERTYYVGIFISLSLVYTFLYMMVDNFTKYNSELINNLSETDKRLSAIVENLPLGAAYIYQNKIFFNKEFTRIFGFSTVEIDTLEKLQQLIFPDSLKEDLRKFKETQNSKNKKAETVINVFTKAKEIKTVEVTIQNEDNYQIILFKDITALYLKEKELADSNYFLENLSKAVPHIIFVFDLEKYITTYASPYIFKILGYSSNELMETNILSLLHSEDINKVKEHAKYFSQVSDDEIGELDYRLFDKKGRTVWIRSIHKVFKRNKEGKAIQVVGIAEDITEKKLAEIQFKNVNERLTLATNAVNFGVWDWDLNSNIFYWDDAMYNLFETNRKQYPNPVEAFQDRVHPEDYEFAWIGIEEAYKNKEKFENSFRIILPDNSVRYIKAVYKFLKDENGNPVRALGINYDVTADKLIEIQHKNNNTLLSVINANINNIFSEQNNINKAINSFLNKVGNELNVDEIFVCSYGNENNLSYNYSWYKIEAENAAVNKNENEIFKSCLKSNLLTKMNALKNGEILKINDLLNAEDFIQLEIKSVLIAPVFVDGIFWGAVVIKDKVKDNFWQQYDDSIFTNFANTIGTVISQNQYKENLKIQVDKAEQALKIKSDFIASVSHEIRTPLNAINGLTNIIANEEIADSLKEKINLLKYATENLNFFVNDILNFNKIESDVNFIEKEPFSIKDLCNDVVSNTTYWVNERGLKLLYDIDTNIPNIVVGDHTKLKHILNNLIANSIKNTKEGYIKLSVEFMKQFNNQSSILFSIEDTSNIANETSLTNINSHAAKHFNIPVTAKIINLLNGKLIEHANKNNKKIFAFELVFDNFNKHTSPENKPQYKQYNFQGKKFLLVEDNEINALIASKFLTSWGATVVEVTNGKEAISVLEKEDFDMVLLDLFMPELDGYATAKKIRSTKNISKANIPIVVITASTSDEIEKAVYEKTFNAYINKPFQPKALNEVINKYLN